MEVASTGPTSVGQLPIQNPKEDGKIKKASEAEKNEGICSRIISFVKNIFTNIIYYITCKTVDLRAKTAMFAKQDGFHFIASLPKTEKALIDTVRETVLDDPLPEDHPEKSERVTTWRQLINTESANNVYAAVRKDVEALSYCIAKTLRAAANQGMSPIEWEMSSLSPTKLTVTLYTKNGAKPNPQKMVEGLQNFKASEWKEQKIEISKENTKLSVSCQSVDIIIDYWPNAMPQPVIEEIKPLEGRC